MRQYVFEQQHDRADRRDDQDDRIDQCRLQIGTKAALALEQRRQAIERRRQRAPRFARSYEPYIELRERLRIGGKAGGERAAGAHLVAHLGEENARPRITSVVNGKPQRPIEILPRGEHDRELPRHLGKGRPVNPAAQAKLDLQQFGEQVAPIGGFGAEHDLPLALQALDNCRLVRRLADAADDVAAGGYG